MNMLKKSNNKFNVPYEKNKYANANILFEYIEIIPTK